MEDRAELSTLGWRHVAEIQQMRKLMLAHLRHGDVFVKRDGAWLFAERNLYLDWIEMRRSRP